MVIGEKRRRISERKRERRMDVRFGELMNVTK